MASCRRYASGWAFSRRLLKSNALVMSSLSKTYSSKSRSHLSISPGHDEEEISNRLDSLLDDSGGRWALTIDGKGLERAFRFKTFNSTWNFMNSVAEHCKKERHHPEWSNIYNKTFVRWTTHKPEGLSMKDVNMAFFSDEQGKVHEEVETALTESGDSFGLKGSGLVENVKQM